MHTAEEGVERRFKLAPVVWIFGLMAACAYLAEGASAEWGALLLMTKGAGLDAASPAFAAFAAAIVVCRLVGELLRRRLTEGVLMTGGSLTAAASLISVLAYGGLLGVPPVIDLIAEQAGLEAALLTAPVLCAAVVAGSLLFRQK